MKRNTRFVYCHRHVFVVALLVLLGGQTVFAQTTAFTYQGKLTDGANPANGSYDLQFALFDGPSSVNQIGSTLTRSATNVRGGIFTVQLDFGVSAFPGANRFLEIGVRPAGIGAFTILTPRQQITATPYAVRSLNASAADTATNASQLGGAAASQYVQTTDSRLSDSRTPTAGSGNYIQNTSAQQNGANFNIQGNGTVGTNLTAGNLTVFGNGTVAGSLNAIQSLNVDGITSLGGSGSVYGYSVPGASPGPYPTIGFNTYGPSYQAGTAGYGGIFQFQNGDGKLIYYNGSNVGAGQPHQSFPQLTITQAGDVGIRTTSPENPLHVNGLGFFQHTGSFRLPDPKGITIGSYFSQAHLFTFDPATSQGYDLLLNERGGNVGIGTSIPDQKLTVNGGASKPGGGSWANFSDERLKNIKGRFTPGLNAVMHLQPLRYEYKRDNALNLKSEGEYVGFSAQAVQKIIPEAVTRNDRGYLLINNDPILWTMLNAIKEQQAEIEAQHKLTNLQTQKIAAQEEELELQHHQLDALKKLVCRSRRRAAVRK